MSKKSSLLYSNDIAGEYPDSYYAATAPLLERRPQLTGDVTCDVCVVGAGFTGLSAALTLAEKGYDVVVLDAHRVGWGASGRNGGQLASGQRVEQDTLEKMVGLDDARKLWDLGQDAKSLIKQRIADHNIDCDLKPGLLYTDHKPGYVEDSKAYAEKLQRDYDYQDVRFIDREEVREMVGTEAFYGGNLMSGSYHLHPLKLVVGMARAAIAAGVRIFEESPVDDLTYQLSPLIKTAQGKVKAKSLVLACNGYLGKLDNKVAARVMPINNFVIATKPLSEEMAKEVIRDDVGVADSRFVVNYYRLSADRRMVFGGGESYSYKFPKDIKSYVRKRMIEIYPQLADTKIDYGWGGTLGITVNRLPHLEQLAPTAWSASGYSGSGVGMANLCGHLVAEAIDHNLSKFELVSKVPSPMFPGGAALRWPILVLAMLYFSTRDKI
ncbi:FAD-binding oxidoreductase [Alphaproteobacteria bacterium]|nr:FAD-binding oxidoreductase [Alphaproteobacteria bacterium]